MDINQPVTNPGLLESIKQMKKDMNNKSLFIKELYKAVFLCPVIIDKQEGSDENDTAVHNNQETKISLIHITSKTGETYLMAFSEWSEVRKWNPEITQKTLLLSFDDYKNFLLSSASQYEGFVLNPFGENRIISKEFMRETNFSETVYIGLPREYPTDMVEKLIELFDNSKSVNAAYLLWMARGEETNYLLVLDAKHSPEELFPKIEDVCKPYLMSTFLDIVLMNDSFALSAIEDQQPFYTG